MSYSKQVLILKENLKGYSISGKSVSGICRIEVEGGVSTIYLSLINFASIVDGEFFLKIVDEKGKIYSFSLGKSPFSTTFVYEKEIDITSLFIAIVHQTKEVLPVCFAKINKNLSVENFVSLLLEEEPIVYNDEVLATENYYLNETEDILDTLPDFEKELNQTIYYDKVKDELNELFNKYPEEERLKKAVDGGKFIKIYYSEEKYYTVGLIKEFDKPKYICYGVPARYSVTPPKELEGYCSFLPLSLLNLKGDGFWMIYQDAITGECVKLND
ncbi:MAG: hypothetical protein E7342_03975 [Clostridiales bacterium]|nr:hypothetical protein [Clostridiales bacterium]